MARPAPLVTSSVRCNGPGWPEDLRPKLTPSASCAVRQTISHIWRTADERAASPEFDVHEGVLAKPMDDATPTGMDCRHVHCAAVPWLSMFSIKQPVTFVEIGHPGRSSTVPARTELAPAVFILRCEQTKCFKLRRREGITPLPRAATDLRSKPAPVVGLRADCDHRRRASR